MNARNIGSLLSIFILLFLGLLHAAGSSAFNNKWEIVRSMSPNINRHTRNFELDIKVTEQYVSIIRTWGRRRDRIDTLRISTDGKPNLVPIKQRTALSTIYSALHAKHGTDRIITATWKEDGRSLLMRQQYEVDISQGTTTLNETHTLTVSKNRIFLTYTIERQSRSEQPTAKYVFKVKDSLEAYVMNLEDNWEVKGDLQRQALLISLQGLANRNAANLYFIYPQTWQFTYTQRLYDWYKEDRGYDFTKLNTPAEALATFRDHVEGYVVWDKDVRTSLIVAYTVAGLEDAVVASEDQIAMLDSLGLSPVADFRGKFTGMNDTKIYRWAKEQYWDRCSRKYIVWLGGHAGRLMLPGVADWGGDQPCLSS